MMTMTTPQDPQVLLRSKSYLRLLILAAVLGAPVSAAAYGFLDALVPEEPERQTISLAGTARLELFPGPDTLTVGDYVDVKLGAAPMMV